LRDIPISVVVATIGRPSALERCLASLRAQTLVPLEVIVVHSGDDSGTNEVCLRQWGSLRVRYLKSPHKGAALQRDLGVREAAHAFILFADDDVVFEPAWIERLAAVVTSDPAVGAAMGAVANQPWAEPRPLWRLYRRLVASRDRAHQPGVVVGALVPNGFPRDAAAPVACEWIGGGVTLLRKEAYASVNGFAAHYRGSSPGEDVDLGYRISRRWKVYYVPAATCQHHHSPVGREDIGHYFYLSMRSRYGFCRSSAQMGVARASWHIALWAAFQTLSEIAQLRRGHLRSDFFAGFWGRVRGGWSCLGWDPSSERFPEWQDTHVNA
jgi:GT2 family glycosyltransferase